MTRLNSLVDVRIIFGIFMMTIIISITLSFFIMLLIFFTKTLHSPANLLTCNTCLATVLYCIITAIQICFFYMEFTFSDCWCRILAYLYFACLNMVSYSYAVQGLSRLFFIVLHRHHHLLHYKSHIIFIICQICISFFISLPSLITKDVVFRPLCICLIPSTKFIHVGYAFISSYFIPFFIVTIIYGVIYYRVKKSSITIRQSLHVIKRDLELIRNILILFIIFLLAGIPSIIYIIILFKTNITSYALYMLSVVSPSFAIVIEKICFIFLNKEIRKEMKKLFSKLHLTRTSINIIT